MSEISLPPILPTVAAPTAQVSAVSAVRLPTELAGMAAGTILTGIVIGREPGGQTVIRTQYGALTLKGGTLPMGGTVTLQLQQTGAQTQLVILSVTGGTPGHREGPAQGLAAPLGGAPQPAADALRMLAGHWDALAEALRAVPTLQTRVPAPGPELAGLALALIDALKRGTLSDWVGRDNARALPGSLSAHLSDDFTHMARLAQSEPDGWRFIPIPLLHHGALDQALLFVRDGRRRDGTRDDEIGTRMLVDIEHPTLGQMQIDALVRPHRFDLIVRSRAELPPALRAGILAIHEEACAIAALAGSVGFHPAQEFVALPIAADTYGVTA